MENVFVGLNVGAGCKDGSAHDSGENIHIMAHANYAENTRVIKQQRLSSWMEDSNNGNAHNGTPKPSIDSKIEAVADIEFCRMSLLEGGNQVSDMVGKTLPLIYIPIKENTDHWYLMVVSMEDEIVYHLDCHPRVIKVNDRRETIKK
ncbi:Ulp1 protease family, C-terminal catalytic domain [Sesbania bispinosa]|nr:Ulp1 protease family, C-terminal catalytic domain [Sesbania bispinosa]